MYIIQTPQDNKKCLYILYNLLFYSELKKVLKAKKSLYQFYWQVNGYFLNIKIMS
jgi:hypothetical protein